MHSTFRYCMFMSGGIFRFAVSVSVAVKVAIAVAGEVVFAVALLLAV